MANSYSSVKETAGGVDGGEIAAKSNVAKQALTLSLLERLSP